MTIRAKQALADCEHALADFEAAANTVFQRPRWVAVMTLLRTVGLVLERVDRPAADAAAQQRYGCRVETAQGFETGASHLLGIH